MNCFFTTIKNPAKNKNLVFGHKTLKYILAVLQNLCFKDALLRAKSGKVSRPLANFHEKKMKNHKNQLFFYNPKKPGKNKKPGMHPKKLTNILALHKNLCFEDAQRRTKGKRRGDPRPIFISNKWKITKINIFFYNPKKPGKN